MARTTSITKRMKITKANRNIVIATGLAAFVLVFAIIAGRAMISQIAYQQRVIDAKKEALAVAQEDLAAVDNLEQSYGQFVAADPNVLGGSISGDGELDGDNSRIVLEALPSKYDFPALTTSLEEIITQQGVQISDISGTDEEVEQGDQEASGEPAPVEIPFQVGAVGSYGSVRDLVSAFQRSIRPFQIQTMELSGGESSMTINIEAQTYYQPEKTLSITEEVVE